MIPPLVTDGAMAATVPTTVADQGRSGGQPLPVVNEDAFGASGASASSVPPAGAPRVLFDSDLNATAEAVARDHAIATAEDHAVPEWIAFARHVVEQVAREHECFISDAIWEAGLGKPPNARTLGSVMTWARREGLIEPTDDFRPSAQKGCHRMPRRVWHSLIYKGGES